MLATSSIASRPIVLTYKGKEINLGRASAEQLSRWVGQLSRQLAEMTGRYARHGWAGGLPGYLEARGKVEAWRVCLLAELARRGLGPVIKSVISR